ncbi:MAG: DUF4446 family protein [Candidatus Paceibacterota bacterium]|jgi:hypothetical protein
MTFEMYIIAGAGIIIFILLLWIIRLEVKIGKLLGSKCNNLDDTISLFKKEISYLKKYAERSADNFDIIEKKLKKTVSGLGTIRFNPFKGTGSGGNQSFATALLNKEGDGVILSSLYSRDHVSIFSKSIKNLVSEYELTTEEKQALQKARESII